MPDSVQIFLSSHGGNNCSFGPRVNTEQSAAALQGKMRDHVRPVRSGVREQVLLALETGHGQELGGRDRPKTSVTVS